jgi:SNF2 family DNA or RNA helicase
MQPIKVEEFINAFMSSTLENWQSEFLQLFSFVVLATYLIHKGSPQSKDSDEEVKRILKDIQKNITKKRS